MLSLQNIRVRSFDLDYLDLYWETSGGDPLDYTFQVLRSEAETGPYEVLTGTFSDRYHFRDATVPSMNQLRTMYYRVRVTRISDSERRDYPEQGGAAFTARLDLEALEIARQIRLTNQEFRGREVIIMPRRTFGQRCTSCTDPVSQSRIRSGCVTCFDTGFVGGYHSPVRTHMHIEGAQGATTLRTPTTRQIVEAARGSLSNYPEVRPGALVIEMENKRWCVEDPVDTSDKLRAVYAQYLTLTALVLTDVAYRVPVNLTDLGDIEPSPDRQYTLPTDPLYSGVRWT